MGFWSDAFSDLEENLEIFEAVKADLFDNINPFSDSFLSGDANHTAFEVESQIAAEEGREIDPRRVAASSEGGISRIGDAAAATGTEVKEFTGTLLDTATNPYVIGTVVAVALAILVAPYAVPAIKAVVS